MCVAVSVSLTENRGCPAATKKACAGEFGAGGRPVTTESLHRKAKRLLRQGSALSSSSATGTSCSTPSGDNSTSRRASTTSRACHGSVCTQAWEVPSVWKQRPHSKSQTGACSATTLAGSTVRVSSVTSSAAAGRLANCSSRSAGWWQLRLELCRQRSLRGKGCSHRNASTTASQIVGAVEARDADACHPRRS